MKGATKAVIAIKVKRVQKVQKPLKDLDPDPDLPLMRDLRREKSLKNKGSDYCCLKIFNPHHMIE
jgi:hypothetical protein